MSLKHYTVKFYNKTSIKKFFTYIYRMSRISPDNVCGQIERTRQSRKVLYHFATFTIVNKILITKNC